MGWTKGKKRGPRQPKPEADSDVAIESKAIEKDRENKWAKREPDERKRTWLAKAGNNWTDTEWRDQSADNILDVPDNVRGWLKDQDLDANWKVRSVFGQEQTRHWNQLMANGWVPLDKDLFPDFQAERDGLVLCVRPQFISAKARKAAAAAARVPIEGREKMLGAGVPGVTGGNHSSAIGFNRINRSVERIEVARDD